MWAGAMKLLAAPLFAALALALMRTQGSQPPTHPTPVRQTGAAILYGGKVDNVLQRNMAALVVFHVNGGSISETLLGPSQRVVTRDGSRLPFQSVRPGDLLLWRANGEIEDTSQLVTDLRGIVSNPLDPGGNALVLLADDRRSIVVDLGSRTRYVDHSGKTASPADLEQADSIDVHGILDLSLGEITQTDTVTRMAP
jgi:hypothetical protein